MQQLRVCVCSYLALAESLTSDRESNCRLIAPSALQLITSSNLTARVKARPSRPSLRLHFALKSLSYSNTLLFDSIIAADARQCLLTISDITMILNEKKKQLVYIDFNTCMSEIL